MGGTLRIVGQTRLNRGIRCSSVHGRTRAAGVRRRVPGRCFITSRVGRRPDGRGQVIILIHSRTGGATSIVLPTNTSLRMGGRIPNVSGSHVGHTLRRTNFRGIGFCGPSKTLNCHPSSDCFTKGKVAISQLEG